MCVRVKRQSPRGSLFQEELRFTTVACILGPARPSPDFTSHVHQSKPMAILNILEFPDPRLRTIAKPVAVVDDEVRQLVDDMFETMYEAPNHGCSSTPSSNR
jgi:peptide deformylase